MIKELTSLRGIFILFIFFHHCLNIYPGGGSMAVAFFFVLGGFSMTLGYRDRVMQPEFSYRQFIVKRAIKFYPLHWICLIAAIPLVGIGFDFKHLASFGLNATLMQTLIPIKELNFSYNAVSWYLADTLLFAIVFPPLTKWIMKAGTYGRIAIASGFAISYIVVAVLIPTEWYHRILYISPYLRLTDFVFGIFLALGYMKLKKRPLSERWNNRGMWLSIIVILMIAALVLESCLLGKTVRHIAPVYWPLVAVVILTAIFLNRNGRGANLLQNQWLQKLGELSFTIFLIHQLVLRYASKVVEHFLLNNTFVYILTTLVITIFVSYMMEKYILKPVTQWLTKRTQPSLTALS